MRAFVAVFLLLFGAGAAGDLSLNSFGEEADPGCARGWPAEAPVREGTVCCASGCGRCGGDGCGGLPGGAAACCLSKIRASGVDCAKSAAPCVVSGPPAPPPAPANATLAIRLSGPVGEVAAEYVSFNIDASAYLRASYDPGRPLDVLTQALSPAHLRVGGTQADYDVYAVGGHAGRGCSDLPGPMSGYRCRVVTEEHLNQLLAFCARNKLTLVFGLNDMFGRPTKSHPEEPQCDSDACPPADRSNLEALVRWLASAHRGAPIHGFELGNELDKTLQGAVGARTQVSDFRSLKKLLTDLWAGPPPKLLGPDPHSYAEFSAAGKSWIETFVRESAGIVDAYTFHEYPFGNGQVLSPADFGDLYLSPRALDKGTLGAKTVVSIVREHGRGVPVWNGEAGSAYGGGKPNITDTFVDGFWYIDQLGAQAAEGVSVFQRQDLVGGGYPMVKQERDGSFKPLPGYWLALLHKRLVGRTVLSMSSSSPYLRVYAHCARRDTAEAASGVLLIYANLADSVTVTLPAEFEDEREEWLLTAGAPYHSAADPLQSFDAVLNGERSIELRPGPSVPELPGRVAKGSALRLPPKSYGFVRFPQAQAPACEAEPRCDLAALCKQRAARVAQGHKEACASKPCAEIDASACCEEAAPARLFRV